ncbi:MAG: hypothetical protein QXZ09_03520 [Candidatus Methanomethylicaceae archaeon]
MVKKNLKLTAVPATDPVVQKYIVKFTEKTKYAKIGHIGWIYQQLVSTNAINFLIVDEEGNIKSVSSFVLDGKDEAVNILTYSESKSIEETREMTEMVKEELRKLGVQKIYAIEWGDYDRGRAAARLFGGEIVGTYIEIPLDKRR